MDEVQNNEAVDENVAAEEPNYDEEVSGSDLKNDEDEDEMQDDDQNNAKDD